MVSGHSQSRKSANHGPPALLRILRSLKQQRLLNGHNTIPLPVNARIFDFVLSPCSCCPPKEKQALGTRKSSKIAIRKTHAQFELRL